MMPPFSKRPRQTTARAWERIGTPLWPAFSGVILVEAEKQLYQGLTVRADRARRLSPVFAPQGAFSTRDGTSRVRTKTVGRPGQT